MKKEINIPVQKSTEILVVEDSITQATQIKHLLENSHYKVSVAKNGKQAMERLSRHKPSLIISDILMPEMNGYDLCKRIKSNKNTENIPVILLTRLTDTEEIIEGLSCGADSFITKPYNEEHLLSSIEKFISDEYNPDQKKVPFGVQIIYKGEKRLIQTEQQNVIKLMLNIYEGAIYQNENLVQTQEELRLLNDRLESLVKERTEKLEAQNALLKALINSPGKVMIFSLNADYCYITFNEKYRFEMKKKWGADIQIGNNLLKFIHNPELRDKTKNSIDRVLNGETFSEVQYQPAEDLYYEFNWNPILQRKEIIGATVFIIDITDIKRAEEKLKISEQYFRKIFEDGSISMALLDSSFHFTDINASFTSYLGYTKEEIVKMTFSDISDKEHLDHDIKQVTTLMKGEIPFYRTEKRYKTKNNEWIWGLVQVCILVDNKGDFLSFLVTIDNITDRKKAEDDLLLKNQQLIEVNAAKDKFFSIIAHDLKSPFQGLLHLTRMMADANEKLTIAELTDFSKSLNESANNLYQLLGNLLEWAMIQNSSINFTPKELNLTAIVLQTIDLMNERAFQKGITIIPEVSENQTIYADERMVEAILRNLISNAVKFTNKDGIIRVRSENNENEKIEIYVSDTGIGMSDDKLKKLFRIDGEIGTTGTAGELSTGLGLILCKEFIEKHGGNILVESKPGLGSTFSFTLPSSSMILNMQSR